MMYPCSSNTKRLFRRALSGIALLSLTAACSSNHSTTYENGLAQAYNTTGIVNVPPYTRSIFSSTNF